MALVNIREVYPGVRLALWQLDERPEDFYSQFPETECYRQTLDAQYKNEGRKLEFLAVRALLASMGIAGEIGHNAAGKPLLKGWHISISHTRGFVAVILSRKHEVAVDIEYLSDRVDRIASKFLRRDEQATDTLQRLVHWCCKETLYKLFSEQDLQYGQMRVKPFSVDADWYCVVENLRTSQCVNVDFELTTEFVLTYTQLP